MVSVETGRKAAKRLLAKARTIRGYSQVVVISDDSERVMAACVKTASARRMAGIYNQLRDDSRAVVRRLALPCLARNSDCQ